MRGTQNSDLSGAMLWVCQPADPAERGRRLTAFSVTVNGLAAVYGARSLADVARMQGMSRATLFRHLETLRCKYSVGLAHEMPAVRKSAVDPDHLSANPNADEGQLCDDLFPLTSDVS